ncbi:MAG: hypothetical protein JSS82_06420 [Bacteroidetes bacterium]|nr:hypothetical protein [Bacteroidota bacterium]
MKRSILALLLLTIQMHASACDVCGCSASNQYLGLLPQLHWNFAGLQYEYSSFSSTHPSLFEGLPDEHAADYYNTVQAWGRYNIGKRLQAFAFVPYHFNRDHSDTSHSATSGLGDISFLLDRIMISDKGMGNSWGHQLIAGAGLKLPTGRNMGITAPDRLGLPNLQPGTGSWDFIINSNYTVRYKKLGLNLDAAYTFTTANKHDFKYGNRLNAGLLAYYSPKPAANITFLPQAGLRYSYTLHDYDNYSKKWLNEQSGGYLLYADLGVQTYYRQFGLRINYQLPLSQYYGAGYVNAGGKINVGIFILF